MPKRAFFLGVLLAAGAPAQIRTQRPEFDAAIIREHKAADVDIDTDVDSALLPGGRFAMRNVPLKALVSWAYSGTAWFIDTFVQDAPKWMDAERFDITAKAPAGASGKMLPMMLQVFLEQQFKLKTHQETRAIDVFALVLGRRGTKMTASVGSGDPDCEWNENPGTNYGGIHRICSSMTMAEFAKELPWLGHGYVDRPVVDLTGLTGAYDFRLDWTGRRNIDKGGLTLFDAVTRLGLRLKERKLPVTVTVVDHVKKLREDN